LLRSPTGTSKWRHHPQDDARVDNFAALDLDPAANRFEQRRQAVKSIEPFLLKGIEVGDIGGADFEEAPDRPIPSDLAPPAPSPQASLALRFYSPKSTSFAPAGFN
jgi:hypothetical protein